MNHVGTIATSPPAPLDRAGAGRLGANKSAEKRRPVRRDPEKRRQQNIQAQKKYHPSRLILNKSSGSALPCWQTDFVVCGCPIQHVQISKLEYGDASSQSYQVLKIGPRYIEADPYMNSIRIQRMCYVDAMWSNCLHLGVALQNFCERDAVSYFSRPTNIAIDDSSKDAMVRTVQNIFKTLKPDLRPTREQITIAHPPFIDILPFPTFRKNLVTNQHKYTIEEMFEDLMEGLVCWGGAGVGRRERDSSTGRASTGAPWDGRSWEAKPWFIRKYWELLGGEEGELVRQSEWWRTMRGEEGDPLLAF
ncbi:hypothetical protein SLS53_008428 [Cytospora paraplurivora]|uniref:Uncharacterized protein n=1 Tax=Cytospora paraplurivora TaxID=2898453 RepID=A0AAN9YD17_9PEZI